MPRLSSQLTQTAGTAGLGAGCVEAFAAHGPEHIYFSGRNTKSADALIAKLKQDFPSVGLTFVEMDLSSLRSVKDAISRSFKHQYLHILMNNAGIIAKPPKLSVDGYEIQFATNHLGHAMLTRQLLPFLLAATKRADPDVRIITNTSAGYEFHRAIKGGISFSELDSGSAMSRLVLGGWIRYGQSKLANIVYASEFARQHPSILSVSIHPGLVSTPMTTEMGWFNKSFVNVNAKLQSIQMLDPADGVLNQLWCAAGAKKDSLRNGAFYLPVGVEASEKLTKEAKSEDLAKKLWEWTDGVLGKF